MILYGDDLSIQYRNLMQLHLEKHGNNTIEAYSEKQVQIGGTIYRQSLLVSEQSIVCPWTIQSIAHLNEESLSPILTTQPKIILIAHQDITQKIPTSTYEYCCTQQIALECMPIGAACRTFNILLGEGRAVVLSIIYPESSAPAHHD